MTTNTSSQFPEVAIVWIDVETTGLVAHKGELLEIAVLVTDLELNLLDQTGYQATVLHLPPFHGDERGVRDLADDFVNEMHETTGLWDRVADRSIAKDKATIEREALEYIRRFVPDKRTARIGGNSVRLDLNFLDEHLPAVAGHLHYRMVDVSTLAGLAQWWTNTPMFPKARNHTAMADIRESIAELTHLRRHLGLSW